MIVGATGLDTVLLEPEDATIESVAETAVAVEDIVDEDHEINVQLDRESSPVEVIISTANPTIDYTYRSNKLPLTTASTQDSKRFKPNPGTPYCWKYLLLEIESCYRM